SASLFPAKKSTTVFETVPVTMSGKIVASRLIFNSFARSATVSNLGLLLHFSISMIVRTLMWSRSANAFCVKCCRFLSDRSFHANKSRGLFIAHHLYFILGCAIAHLNNHINHVI